MRPRDSGQDGAVEAESAASAQGALDLLGKITPSVPIVAVRSESVVVRSMAKEAIAKEPIASEPVAGAGGTAADHLMIASRVSRVISIGSSGGLGVDGRERGAPPSAGTVRAAAQTGENYGGEDDEDATVVDGSRDALSDEQHAALARRIRTALESTMPMGTPTPSQVQPNANDQQKPQLRFNRTMLIGLPQPAPTMPPALRASFVRDVGPPTTPPPRRNRRSAPTFGGELESEPPDHEAFELDHPIVAPEDASDWADWADAASQRDAAPQDAAYAGAEWSAHREPALILPPPPGFRDFEPAPPEPDDPPQRLQGGVIEWPPRVVASMQSTIARPSRPVPFLSELPSSDPFAGFSAPPPSSIQRWGIVIVVALAVVGLFSLAAIAFGLLGKTGW